MTAFDGATLELLFEREGLPRIGLPRELLETYAGDLGFEKRRLFANFVASVDGVVALPGDEESGHVISQDSEADRFVMGLLRACADAVLIGAGTFRKAAGHLWHAEAIYPAGAAHFAEVRKRLGLRTHPSLVLVTGSGDIDPRQPALADALIVTTASGEARLRGSVPPSTRFCVLGSGKLDLKGLLDVLYEEGSRRVLTEGGPSLVANLIEQDLLDELFVTSAPSLFGRYPDDRRKTLAYGVDLGGVPLELLSVRRSGSQLFLRYSLRSS